MIAMKFVNLRYTNQAIIASGRTRVSLLENGPPVGYPLQYRVSGEDINLVREWAQKVAKM
jgi:multidrug efflux pump